MDNGNEGLIYERDPVGFTSSIFLWMSCSWSSHSCISESKLSIWSDLSLPQARPLCSSPRSRSMAAMTQAALYPGASECQFPLSTVSQICQCRVACCGVGGAGRMDRLAWKLYKEKHMIKMWAACFIPLNLSFLEAYLLYFCDLCGRFAHRKVRNLQPSPLTFLPKMYSHLSQPIRVDLCDA